jgi:hypothetical protein
MVNTALGFAMHQVRPAFLFYRRFGRGPVRLLAAPAVPAPVLSADLKLFMATFVAGFLFVSILIG